MIGRTSTAMGLIALGALACCLFAYVLAHARSHSPDPSVFLGLGAWICGILGGVLVLLGALFVVIWVMSGGFSRS